MNSITHRSGIQSRLKDVCETCLPMDQLLVQIAKSLVDRSEDVQVTTVNGNQSTILELRVAKEDVGKIIGRHGRTAQAIRTLLGAVSSKSKIRTVLEIIE